MYIVLPSFYLTVFADVADVKTFDSSKQITEWSKPRSFFPFLQITTEWEVNLITIL
jgi:hypothetical protein